MKVSQKYEKTRNVDIARSGYCINISRTHISVRGEMYFYLVVKIGLECLKIKNQKLK